MSTWSSSEAGRDRDIERASGIHRGDRAAPPRLPGVWRVGLSRGRVELKAFFRERQAVVFIFAMPAVMLVLLGAIFAARAAARASRSVICMWPGSSAAA